MNRALSTARRIHSPTTTQRLRLQWHWSCLRQSARLSVCSALIVPISRTKMSCIKTSRALTMLLWTRPKQTRPGTQAFASLSASACTSHLAVTHTAAWRRLHASMPRRIDGRHWTQPGQRSKRSSPRPCRWTRLEARKAAPSWKTATSPSASIPPFARERVSRRLVRTLRFRHRETTLGL